MTVWRALIYGDLIVERVADGLDPICIVFCEIFQSQDTTLALDKLDNRFGDSSLVVSCFAMLCDGAEGLCKVR